MKRSETLNYKLGYKDGYKAALKTLPNKCVIAFVLGVLTGILWIIFL